jgi:hypothetical protein
LGISRGKYRKKAFMINKIITNVVLGSTLLGGGMIGLTTHPLAMAQPPPKEQPKYDDKATEHLKVLRWSMDFKKCMEFLKTEGKNADPTVSVGYEWNHLGTSGRLYPGITLLEEAILNGSLEDVRMLISHKNVRGIDLEEMEWDPQNLNREGKLEYGHTLIHTAVASPEEMEKRWKKHFGAIKSGMETDAKGAKLIDKYPDVTAQYPELITKKRPQLRSSQTFGSARFGENCAMFN